MFVTVAIYRARVGEDDAIIALYEDWQRTIQPRTKGFLSGELLRKVAEKREFIAIMRFESQEAAHALANDPGQDTWYRRIASLSENAPVLAEYIREWP
jgi:heme-degrading monooxygenase HmoA